jgi:hypothetical protein
VAASTGRTFPSAIAPPAAFAPRVHAPGLSSQGPRIAVIQAPTPLPMAIMPSTGASPGTPDFNGQALAAAPNELRPGTLDIRIAQPTGGASVSWSPTGPGAALSGTRAVTGAASRDAGATLANPALGGPALSLSGPRLASLEGAPENPNLTVPAPGLAPAPSLVPQTGAVLSDSQPQQVTTATRATLTASGPRLAALDTAEPVANLNPLAPAAAPVASPVPQTASVLSESRPEQITAASHATLGLRGARTSDPEVTAPTTLTVPVAVPASAPLLTQAAGYPIAMAPTASKLSANTPPAGDAVPSATAKLRAVQVIVNDEKVDLSSLPGTPSALLAVRDLLTKSDGNLYWFAKAAYLKTGATLVPLQFVADSLRVSLRFNPDSGQLLISSNDF